MDNRFIQETPVARYQSIFTGQQIDERLNDVVNKVSISTLEKSLDGGEGSQTIGVSAYALKALKEYTDERFKIFTGESASEYVPFTQTLYDRVYQNNWYFQGIFENATLRDASIVPGVDTEHFIGVEMCILNDNGSGEKVIQRWNVGIELWEDFITGFYAPTNTEIPFSGTIPIGSFTFPFTKSALFFVSGLSDSGTQQSLILSVIYDGTDSYMTTFAELSTNNTPWFSVSITGTSTVVINAVAITSGNIRVKAIDTL